MNKKSWVGRIVFWALFLGLVAAAVRFGPKRMNRIAAEISSPHSPVTIFLDKSRSSEERNQAIFSISHSKDLVNQVPVGALLKGLDDPTLTIRRHITIALALVECDPDDRVKLFRKALGNSDFYAQARAVDSAEYLGSRAPELVPEIREFLNRSQDWSSVGKAFKFLQLHGAVIPEDYELAGRMVAGNNLGVAEAAATFLRTNAEYAERFKEAIAAYDSKAGTLRAKWAEERLKEVPAIADPRERLVRIDQELWRLGENPTVEEQSFGPRLNDMRTTALAEIRENKKKEQAPAPSSLPVVSLLDLWKRITSYKPPFPVSPAELSKLAGVPVFRSGPHVAEFDPGYLEDFGHYNPAFIEWAKKNVIPRDAAYFQVTFPIFEKIVAYPVERLLAARYALNAEPDELEAFLSKYQAALRVGESFKPWDHFKYRQDFPHDATYVAYWLRRHIDGTAPVVQEFLEILLDAYSPERLAALQRPNGDSTYALALPGQYHGSEVSLTNAEKVLTLDLDSKNVLEPDVVLIEMVEDALEEKEDKMTGKKVTLKSGRDGRILALRGPFSPGSFKTVSIPPLDGCTGSGCEIKLGKRTYELKVAHVEDVVTDMGADPTRRYLIELSDGSNKRIIPDVRYIVWAGDLDGDGKLDLLYDDVFHYNVGTSLRLMLSKPAKVGLMTEVAFFRSVGC